MSLNLGCKQAGGSPDSQRHTYLSVTALPSIWLQKRHADMYALVVDLPGATFCWRLGNAHMQAARVYDSLSLHVLPLHNIIRTLRLPWLVEGFVSCNVCCCCGLHCACPNL